MITRDISKGLKYCHDLGVLHKDLKPQNIMVKATISGALKVKLIDFGVSKLLSPGETCKDGQGTLLFQAPEIFLGENQSFSSDIWSLGIIIHYIATGTYPFKKLNNKKELAELIVTFSLSLSDKLKTNPILLDLVQKCLTVKEQRLTISEVLSHKWFKKVLGKETKITN